MNEKIKILLRPGILRSNSSSITLYPWSVTCSKNHFQQTQKISIPEMNQRWYLNFQSRHLKLSLPGPCSFLHPLLIPLQYAYTCPFLIMLFTADIEPNNSKMASFATWEIKNDDGNRWWIVELELDIFLLFRGIIWSFCFVRLQKRCRG